MAKATPNLNFSVLLPTEGSLKTFVTMLRSVYQNLVSVINGSLGFGDGTSPDNINGAWINVVAPVAPNTDFTVTHNLNRLPVGYWIMQKDRACDVYTGSVAATKTQLTLRATVASAVLRLFIVGALLSLLCLGAAAQTTSVTLQVTDAGAQSWNNGTWSVLLVSPPGTSPTGPPFNIIGGGTVPNQSQSGVLSATGGASMTLTQSGVIAPTLSLWQFKVCPAAGIPFQCFISSQTVAGASQTVTLVPPAISVSCGPSVSAYADVEAICGVGGHYYNLTSQADRVCQAVSGNSCTTFANAGGGGGVPGGTNGQLQYNNSGVFGGMTNSTISGSSLTINPGTITASGITATNLSVSNGIVSGTNCSSSASPAACGSNFLGSVVVAAAATSVQVNTTAVTASSQILLTRDDSLSTKLSVTCNTATVMGEMKVSARTNGTSFTITVQTAPVTNPGCISYAIIN